MRSRSWQPFVGLLVAIGIFVLVLLGVFFFVIHSVDAPTPEQGQKRAAPLIVALEIYRQGWGKHPTDLQQLVPDFLPEIPKAGWRYPFSYSACEKGVGYILYFKTRDVNYCGFFSTKGEWACGGDDSTWPRSFYFPCAAEN